MSLWKQLPGATKVYLAILAYLSIMLVVLVSVRLMVLSEDRFSLIKIFTRREESETATVASRILLTSTAASISPFSPGTPWLRTTTSIKIFNGPGNEFGNIAMLEEGEVVELIGVSADRRWWEIKVPYFENGVGWVSADQVVTGDAENVPILLMEVSTPTNQGPSQEIPTARAYANVNIRSGPDMFFEKVGILKTGQTAEVVGKSEDGFWWAIKIPGTDNNLGWVAKDYVIPTNTDKVPKIPREGIIQDRILPTPPPGAPSLTALFPLNVRSGPGTEYAVISQMEQGQTAEVIGVSVDGLWVAIKFLSQPNERGWVAAAYVELINASKVPIMK